MDALNAALRSALREAFAEIGVQDRITITGHATGHLSGPDLIVGLDAFLSSGVSASWLGVAAGSAYAFGAGLMAIPEHS